MKPRALDYLMLVYVLALFFAAGAAIGRPEATFWHWLLALFPWGFFLVALVAIVLKNILALNHIDFGLSKARWASIIAFIAACFITALNLPFAIAFIDAQRIIYLAPAHVLEIGETDLNLSAPYYWSSYFVFACLTFAVVALFLGWQIGPKSQHVARKSQSEPQ